MITLITGGTGFVGQRLINSLHQQGHNVWITSRNTQRAARQLGSEVARIIPWKPNDQPIDLIDTANVSDHQGENETRLHAVVNLMGEPIAEGRWTEAKKNRIRDSRVVGTRNLIDGILAAGNLPQVFVSASAVGYYGNCGEDTVTESRAPASGFLADVCREWETEADRLREHGVRVINLRIGIVLGNDGGALQQLVPIFKWGLGGKLGSGKQWVPWIHVDDLVRMIVWSIETHKVHGPVNATAPNPVRNSELTAELARAVHRPAIIPVPKFALRLALGEFAKSLFSSQKVLPENALSHGFSFRFSELSSALEDLLA